MPLKWRWSILFFPKHLVLEIVCSIFVILVYYKDLGNIFTSTLCSSSVFFRRTLDRHYSSPKRNIFLLNPRASVLSPLSFLIHTFVHNHELHLGYLDQVYSDDASLLVWCVSSLQWRMMWVRLGALWIWAWLLTINVLGKRYVLMLCKTDDDQHTRHPTWEIISKLIKDSGLRSLAPLRCDGSRVELPASCGTAIKWKIRNITVPWFSLT